MTAFLRMVIDKFTSGDVTLVEAIRWVNEWSGKVLALVDGVPMPMAMGCDESETGAGEAYSLYCQLHELVHGEPPAMGAGEAGAVDPMSVLLAIIKLVEILRKRQ